MISRIKSTSQGRNIYRSEHVGELVKFFYVVLVFSPVFSRLLLILFCTWRKHFRCLCFILRYLYLLRRLIFYWAGRETWSWEKTQLSFTLTQCVDPQCWWVIKVKLFCETTKQNLISNQPISRQWHIRAVVFIIIF